MDHQFHWLTTPKQKSAAVSFGAPWARGTLSRENALKLTTSEGKAIPAQFSPMAFWPDGSVKWTRVSAVLPSDASFSVQPGEGILPDRPVTAQETENGIILSNGLLSVRFSLGRWFMDGLARNGFDEGKACLSAYLERHQEEDGLYSSKVYSLIGDARKVTLEESGPVRAVVKIEGVHVPLRMAEELKETYFPFTLRVYCFAGSDELRIVHSFGIDLDQETDYLKGVCVEFHVPNGGELYNRHVGFTGESGMFYEGCRNMFKGGGIWRKTNVLTASTPQEFCEEAYRRQIRDGQFVALDPVENADFIDVLSDNAAWDHFLLRQMSPDSYRIEKQTHHSCAMIPAAFGTRSSGGMFFGSEKCIMALAIRDFWRKAPRALEADGIREGETVLKAWLYSRYEDAYDFSAYDTVVHQRSYEGRNNVPEGICNTNEICLRLFDCMPGKEPILALAQDAQEEILPVADPKLYQDSAVFGSFWFKKENTDHSEKIMRSIGRFYLDQIEQRRWYGFWDYGDVMHTYDAIRHTWRYDVGGFAWQNTELCNTYMNWYAFLLTGDPDLFRLAEAMSRHCSEVELYHFGELKMLGSRHNVRHWGCNAKEPRISMAGHHRFYYFLTGDERMGDNLDLVVDADLAAAKYDIMGITYFGKHDDPRYAHMRSGPDWTSFVSNWMTSWERHEDQVSRDKIMAGLKSISEAPFRLCSGTTFHYDTRTGAMYDMGDASIVGHTHPAEGNYQYYMMMAFGGAEILFELAEWLPESNLEEMLLEYADYCMMQPEERIKASNGRFNDENMDSWGNIEQGGDFLRIFAYAAMHGNDRGLPLLKKHFDGTIGGVYTLHKMMKADGTVNEHPVEGIDTLRPVTEAPSLITNSIAQQSISNLEVLHFLENIGWNGDPILGE